MPVPGDALPLTHLRSFSWLVAGRVLRLGVSLTVGAWVARHLAPADFGTLSYLIALVALPAALAAMGLDGLIVRDLVSRRHEAGEILGTALGLRVGAGVVLYLGLLAFGWGELGPGPVFLMLAMLGLEIVLQGANVFDLYFQARVANKWTVAAGTLATILASAVRVALILGGASVVAFAGAVMLEAILIAAGLAWFYRRMDQGRERWRFSQARARALLGESWPMIVSAVAIAGCMRLDQVLLRVLAGEAAVGVYAAAARLGEAWYFLPMFLGTALNPWILAGRSLGPEVYRQRLLRFYAGMIWGAATLAVLVALAAGPLVSILFGADYLEAINPLRIHVIGGVFLALGMAAGKWYLAEGYAAGLMRKALFGLAVSVAGNLLLIPRYGVSGAAAAAAAGHFAANVGYDLLDPRVRPQLALKLRALAPWSLAKP